MNVIEMLRKLVEFCRKDDITFRPNRENVLSKAAFPTMIMDYFRACYERVKKTVMESCGSSEV